MDTTNVVITPNPPKPCDHKFILKGTGKEQELGRLRTFYTRVDYFFCERCLKQGEIHRAEYSKYEPLWWKA